MHKAKSSFYHRGATIIEGLVGAAAAVDLDLNIMTKMIKSSKNQQLAGPKSDSQPIYMVCEDDAHVLCLRIFCDSNVCCHVLKFE